MRRSGPGPAVASPDPTSGGHFGCSQGGGPGRAHEGARRVIRRDTEPASMSLRLMEAAERGEAVELILVARGTLRPGPGAGRWRLRVDGRRVLSFDAGAVLALTPDGRQRRGGR